MTTSTTAGPPATRRSTFARRGSLRGDDRPRHRRRRAVGAARPPRRGRAPSGVPLGDVLGLRARVPGPAARGGGACGRAGGRGDAGWSLISRRAVLGAAPLLALGARRGRREPAPLRCGGASTRFPGSPSRRNFRRRAATMPGRRSSRPARADAARPRDVARRRFRLSSSAGRSRSLSGGARRAARGAARSTDAAIQAFSAQGLSRRRQFAGQRRHALLDARAHDGATDAPEFPAYLALVGEVAARLRAARARRAGADQRTRRRLRARRDGARCGGACWSARAQAAPALTLVASAAAAASSRASPTSIPATVARFGPLLETFHFYEPYLFTHQGAPWMGERVYHTLTGVPWPGSEGSYDDDDARHARRTWRRPAPASEER